MFFLFWGCGGGGYMSHYVVRALQSGPPKIIQTVCAVLYWNQNRRLDPNLDPPQPPAGVTPAGEGPSQLKTSRRAKTCGQLNTLQNIAISVGHSQPAGGSDRLHSETAGGHGVSCGATVSDFLAETFKVDCWSGGGFLILGNFPKFSPVSSPPPPFAPVDTLPGYSWRVWGPRSSTRSPGDSKISWNIFIFIILKVRKKYIEYFCITQLFRRGLFNRME